jgi:hypothetical protein
MKQQVLILFKLMPNGAGDEIARQLVDLKSSETELRRFAINLAMKDFIENREVSSWKFSTYESDGKLMAKVIDEDDDIRWEEPIQRPPNFPGNITNWIIMSIRNTLSIDLLKSQNIWYELYPIDSNNLAIGYDIDEVDLLVLS